MNEGSIHGDGPPYDGWAYRGPDIQEIPDGRLLMTATRFETRGDQLFDPDSEALQWPELLVFLSEDKGYTWSDPQKVPLDLQREKYTANGAGRFLQMVEDRWLYFLETGRREVTQCYNTMLMRFHNSAGRAEVQ